MSASATKPPSPFLSGMTISWPSRYDELQAVDAFSRAAAGGTPVAGDVVARSRSSFAPTPAADALEGSHDPSSK